MNDIQAEEVRAELERILASPRFAGAGRLGPFLRYTVEAVLSGDSGRLKESVLGVEVFQRKADYDPRIDPIVRVEARRLRSRLDEYYRDAGASDSIIIELPKGTYVPVFRRREETPASADKSGGTAAPVPVLEPEPKRGRARVWYATAAAALFGVVAIAWFGSAQRRPAPTVVRSVAVLPFENLSPDPNNAYFADGLATELTDTLTRAGNMRVIAWTSSSQYRGKPYDVQEVGRRFNVDTVIEGSVRKDGNRLRITAQVVDTRDGRRRWSKSYDRQWKDIFAVQEELARAIAGSLNLELRLGGANLLAERYTSNLEAYNLTLKGRAQMNRYSVEGLQRAIDYMTEAKNLEPRYAPAYAGIATAYSLLGWYREGPPDALARAKSAAQTAVEIDPGLAEAHAALCFALAAGEWKWDQARTECERAIELNPGSADAHQVYAMGYLAPRGELEHAIAEARKAVDLDPLSFLPTFILGYLYTMNHQESLGIEQYRRAVEIVRDTPNLWWDLGMAYAYSGDTANALESFRKGGIIREGPRWQLGVCELVLLGRMDEAKRMAARLRDYQGWRLPMDAARSFAMVGDAERTAYWLERAYEVHDGDLTMAGIDRRFDGVRGDARVQAVLKKVGVAKETTPHAQARN